MHSDSNDKEDDKMTGVFDDEEWSDCDEEGKIYIILIFLIHMLFFDTYIE